MKLLPWLLFLTFVLFLGIIFLTTLLLPVAVVMIAFWAVFVPWLFGG
jgi:hypothetical protein